MEYSSQASMAPNRKETKPEESVPSCSGKISRTGEQYGSPWELLPEEMVVSIFKLLPNKDLLACRAVCKRFVTVLGEGPLPSAAKAFCKQFSQPPDPTLFGRDRYKQVLRPWFETFVTAQPWFEMFVTAQQRLTYSLSDDLQFSDIKREETQRQASSEQVGQVQPVKSSQVILLDRLIDHEEFPKVLFFILAKTLQNTESLYLQAKVSNFCPYVMEDICFSSDFRSLLETTGKSIRFMVIDGNDNVIWQKIKCHEYSVGNRFRSPDGRTLLIGFCDNIRIMGLDGGEWVKTGEIRCDGYKSSVFFSPDSNSLATVFVQSVQTMDRDEKGNWVQNCEIPLGCVKKVYFSPGGGSLAILTANEAWIMDRDEKGSWVQNCEIPLGCVKKVYFSPSGGSLAISNSNAVLIMRSDEKGNRVRNIEITCAPKSLCYSPDGGSLAISGSHNNRNAVLIMRSDQKGNWVQDFMIPHHRTRECSSIWFSPDGRNLMLEPVYSSLHSIIGLDRENNRVYEYRPFRLNSGASAFSPDGGILAIGCYSTTWIMGLDKGKWIRKACISNGGSMDPSPWTVEGSSPARHHNIVRGGTVSSVYFSSDSRRLAIVSNYGIDYYPNWQVCIYEIKTGTKVLKDHDDQFLKGFFSA